MLNTGRYRASNQYKKTSHPSFSKTSRYTPQTTGVTKQDPITAPIQSGDEAVTKGVSIARGIIQGYFYLGQEVDTACFRQYHPTHCRRCGWL